MADTGYTRFLTSLSKLPRGWYFLGAFVVSGFLWVLIFWGASLIVRGADYARDAEYQPPKCRATVCEMYGPGGLVGIWRLSVQLANLAKKPIVVPAGKTCASACALAIGFALQRGYDVRISPRALFIPHNLDAIKDTPMPPAFKRRMLAYVPFHWT